MKTACVVYLETPEREWLQDKVKGRGISTFVRGLVVREIKKEEKAMAKPQETAKVEGSVSTTAN